MKNGFGLRKQWAKISEIVFEGNCIVIIKRLDRAKRVNS
jgi:hypothetical protein